MDSVLKCHSARPVVFHVTSVRFVFGALGKLPLHLFLLFFLILLQINLLSSYDSQI
jgi:hypothetical protein